MTNQFQVIYLVFKSFEIFFVRISHVFENIFWNEREWNFNQTALDAGSAFRWSRIFVQYWGQVKFYMAKFGESKKFRSKYHQSA